MSSAGDAVEVVEQTGAEVYLGHTRFTAPNIVRRGRPRVALP